MSVEIVGSAEHDLGYRFTDSIEGLSCLQVQVLLEALKYRNERIRESLETQSGEVKIDPAALYRRIRGQWTRYIEFPDDAYYDLVTLWTIGTYFFPLFNAYPYLYFAHAPNG